MPSRYVPVATCCRWVLSLVFLASTAIAAEPPPDDRTLLAADAARALALVQASIEPGTFSEHAGRAYLAMGRALQAQGKSRDARSNFLAAAQHLESALGPDHPESRAARKFVESVPIT